MDFQNSWVVPLGMTAICFCFVPEVAASSCLPHETTHSVTTHSNQIRFMRERFAQNEHSFNAQTVILSVLAKDLGHWRRGQMLRSTSA